MKKRKKQRLNKVLIVLSIIMFIIGGYIIMKKLIFDVDTKKVDNKENIKNNDVYNNEEVVDNGDQASSDLLNAPLNNLEYKNLVDGEYLTSKGYTLKIENGVASVDGILIVNKTYSLPSTFKPVNPNTEVTEEKCNSCLDKEVMNSFNLMRSDASSIGLNIYIASGYRSYTYQENLYNNYTMVSGINGADTYSARPGHSEHQTGLCFDLNSVDDNFFYTDEGKWVNENAYLYGFVIRYPKGKDDVTGYKYESWHLRYVGEALAKELYNNGDWITLEEYFGLSSSY